MTKGPTLPAGILPGDGADPDDVDPDDVNTSDLEELIAQLVNDEIADAEAREQGERMQKLMDAVEL